MRQYLITTASALSIACSDPVSPTITATDGPRGKGLRPGAERIQDLQPADELTVRYHSRGCFHDYGAELHFTAPDGQIEVAGRAWNRFGENAVVERAILTQLQITGLDLELGVLRGGREEGLCTTETNYAFSWKHLGMVRVERIVDSSCALFRHLLEENAPKGMSADATFETLGARALYRKFVGG
jgi:hypothetical protein